MRGQPSRPALPVRQDFRDHLNDTPVKQDPYSEQPWPGFDEDDEEGEEEEAVEDGDDEEA